MKLVQPPEWYEKNLSDKSEECGAGNPEAYEQKCTDGIPNKPCIHCGTLMEDDGTESPICDECWEEMWEEREKEKGQSVFIDEDGVEYPTDYTIYLRK